MKQIESETLPRVQIDSFYESGEAPCTVHFDIRSYRNLLVHAGLTEEQIARRTVKVIRGPEPTFGQPTYPATYDFFSGEIEVPIATHWWHYQAFKAPGNIEGAEGHNQNTLRYVNQQVNHALLHETGHAVDFVKKERILFAFLINLGLVGACLVKAPFDTMKRIRELKIEMSWHRRKPGVLSTLQELGSMGWASFESSYYYFHDLNPFEARADRFTQEYSEMNGWGQIITVEPKEEKS